MTFNLVESEEQFIEKVKEIQEFFVKEEEFVLHRPVGRTSAILCTVFGSILTSFN